MKSRINWFLHLSSIQYLRLQGMSTHKMQCEFAQHLEKRTNSKRIKYFGRSENLIAESLGSLGFLGFFNRLTTIAPIGHHGWVECAPDYTVPGSLESKISKPIGFS